MAAHTAPQSGLREQQQQAAQRQPLTEDELEQQRLEEEAAEIEAEAAAAAGRRELEAQAARAWTAHTSADGQLYYHNSVTGESSWTRPATYVGDAAPAAASGPPKPVAQAAIAGTDWVEVKCSDGRRYFYNNNTRVTEWTMPAEVADVKRRQAEEAAAADARARAEAAEQRAAAARRTAAMGAASSTAAAGAQQPAPPPAAGAPAPIVMGMMMPPPHSAAAAEALRAAHMQRLMAARGGMAHFGGAAGGGGGGPPPLSREVRVQRFKLLLLEGGVNAFSLYAKVKAKLEGDERWRLLPNDGERRSVFDDFCKCVCRAGGVVGGAAGICVASAAAACLLSWQ